jgi:hypothetical protein
LALAPHASLLCFSSHIKYSQQASKTKKNIYAHHFQFELTQNKINREVNQIHENEQKNIIHQMKAKIDAGLKEAW